MIMVHRNNFQIVQHLKVKTVNSPAGLELSEYCRLIADTSTYYITQLTSKQYEMKTDTCNFRAISKENNIMHHNLQVSRTSVKKAVIYINEPQIKNNYPCFTLYKMYYL